MAAGVIVYDQPWVHWISTGTAASYQNLAWQTWSAVSTTTDTSWYIWNQVGTGYGVGQQRFQIQPRPETAEQVVAREAAYAARQEAWRLAEGERVRVARIARRRARTLLRSCLTRDQKRSLKHQGYFDVRAIRPDGIETAYRIHQGSHGNVDELDQAGKPARRFCVQPSGVPVEDSMLAQKLWIEHDIAAFERRANVTNLRTGRIQHATG